MEEPKLKTLIMNRLTKLTFLSVSLAMVMSACKTEDPEPYWYSYGTFLEKSSLTNDFVVELDNNLTLIPNSVAFIQSEVKDSSRVIALYSVDSETDSTVNGNDVQIEGILTKNIIQLTEANQDSIGNDEVQLNDDNIWLSENHLNIIFGYYAASGVHFFNLVKPIGEQLDENGRQILEFRHNRNNDPYSSYYTGIVSFDMRSLYAPGMDSINFVLQAKDFDNGVYSWVGTYHFGNQVTTKSTIKSMLRRNTMIQ
jgi:hypothetical protein